jgi:hypothetical protein
MDKIKKSNRKSDISTTSSSSIPINQPVVDTNTIPTGNMDDDPTELPNLIKQFITIQTNMNDLKKQIKIQNIQYKLIQQRIIQFMQSKQLQNIDTQQNILSIRSTNVKQHINMSLLSNYFNKKHGISMETIETFLDQVPTKVTNTLIIKPK